MARAKPKWGFRSDHDARPETRPEILEPIRERAEFEIPGAGMKELSWIIGFFNAGREHELLKNRPRTRDEIKTLKDLAKAWSKGARPTEKIDDVTMRNLIEAGAPAALIKAAEDGRPVDFSILADHARRQASELQEKLENHKKLAEYEGRKGMREKSIDYTFNNFIRDLAEFFTKHTGKVAAANYSQNYVAKGKPETETPFVRFIRLCLENIEPRYLRNHNNPSSLGYRIRKILDAQKLCPVTRKQCPPQGPFPTCPFDKKPCPCI